MVFVDPSLERTNRILQEARVAESPLGRVPKQNPDTTISMKLAQSSTTLLLRSPDTMQWHGSPCGGKHAAQGSPRDAQSAMFHVHSSGTSCERRMSRNLLLGSLAS